MSIKAAEFHAPAKNCRLLIFFSKMAFSICFVYGCSTQHASQCCRSRLSSSRSHFCDMPGETIYIWLLLN